MVSTHTPVVITDAGPALLGADLLPSMVFVKYVLSESTWPNDSRSLSYAPNEKFKLYSARSTACYGKGNQTM